MPNEPVPCRLLECSNSQRRPVTDVVEWLPPDEIAQRNRDLVLTTQRWFPVPRDEWDLERETLVQFAKITGPDTANYQGNILHDRMLARRLARKAINGE